MNESKPPYDLHPQGGGGFVTFELSAEKASIQLIALDKATLRGEGETLLVLEFNRRSIQVAGAGLAPLTDLLLSGRVKTIRPGTHEGCSVTEVRLYEE